MVACSNLSYSGVEAGTVLECGVEAGTVIECGVEAGTVVECGVEASTVVACGVEAGTVVEWGVEAGTVVLSRPITQTNMGLWQCPIFFEERSYRCPVRLLRVKVIVFLLFSI
ncbi:per-hexamer repeat protein 5 [Biomphalaria glabrata]